MFDVVAFDADDTLWFSEDTFRHNENRFVDLVSPYAPHIAEELWQRSGNETGTVTTALFPVFNEEYLVESSIEYPVSFNGKLRFKVSLSVELSSKEIEAHILNMPEAHKYLEGKTPKKTIIVPGRIVNFVI